MRLTFTAALMGLALCSLAPRVQAQFTPHVEWREEWREVGPVDYAITGAALVGLVSFELAMEPPEQSAWSGGPFLDVTARTWLRIEGSTGRKVASAVSDVLFFATTGLAVGVDPLLVALVVHDDSQLAWQLFVINAEAVSVALFLSRPVQKFSARERPLADECARDPDYDARCPVRADSFYSAQTAGAFAAASATCMAHARIPLYGGGWGDDAACIGSMLAASGVGALQVAADLHWFTDVLLGAGVGMASGYLLPWLLHYRPGRSGPVAGVVPVLSRQHAALAVVGVY
jgi:membrane-associated phospholipid phosphatase